MEILRGDIFYVAKHGYAQAEGSEQEAGRPALIVSNNDANKFSRSVSVVYLTTQDKKPLPTHCEVVARTKSTALCEGVTTIAKERLLDYVKSCTREEMNKVDECLAIALGLGKTPDPTATVENGLLDDLKMKLEGAERELDELKTARTVNENALKLTIRNLKEELDEVKKQPVFEPDPEEVVKLKAQVEMLEKQNEKLLDRLIG